MFIWGTNKLKFKGSQKRSDDESDKLGEREEQLALIKQYFSKFGDRIINAIRTYAQRDRGLHQLFKKLNIHMPKSFQQQLESILGFINVYGEKEFVNKVLYSEQDFTFKIKPIIHNLPTQEGQPPIPTDPKTIASPRAPVEYTKIPRRRYYYQHQQQYPPYSNVPPQTPSAPPAYPQAPPYQTPPKEMLPFPPQSTPMEPQNLTWPAVEKRSGEDRRVGKSRRQTIEMIFKNKRFGRDRRSGIERRKNWSPQKTEQIDTKGKK